MCVFVVAIALLVALVLSSPPPAIVVLAFLLTAYVSFSVVPNKRLGRPSKTFLLISFFLLLAYGACVIRPPRPLFANEYGYHPEGRPPWPRWWVSPPHAAESGWTSIADIRLNLLVVFMNDDLEAALGMPIATDTGVVFTGSRGGQLIEFHVPSAEDRLLLFRHDGTRAEYRLSEGEAKRLYTQLELENADFGDVLDAMDEPAK